MEITVLFTDVHFLTVDVWNKADHGAAVDYAEKLVSMLVVRVVNEKLTLC